MCLYPRLVTNPKYKANKKNGGVIPAVPDERVKLVPIGCQNCIECRKQKAREWQIRLAEDIKTNTNGKFITLTFSDESIQKLTEDRKLKELHGYELDNELATRAVRLWLERWRKHNKKSIRHWLVTELGHNGTENIHLHGIVWTDKPIEEIRKTWQYGFVWPTKEQEKNNYVSARTVNYIIKYLTKKDEIHKEYKSIILTSAGIGSNYTNTWNSMGNKYNKIQTNETYRTTTGHKMAMPTYWRNKIYSEEEREKLWLQKLDKQIRYVCGEKIDISKTDKEYYEILKYHRERNKELGYGTDEKNWNREQYEREQRILKQEKRKNKNDKKNKEIEKQK